MIVIMAIMDVIVILSFMWGTQWMVFVTIKMVMAFGLPHHCLSIITGNTKKHEIVHYCSWLPWLLLLSLSL